MKNTIQVNMSVIYSEDDESKSSRFLDESSTHAPVSYNTGKASLRGNQKNHELASNVNLFVMHSNAPVTLKIGDTTHPEMTNMKVFVYDGDTTTIFVSNPGVDPVQIDLVTAKY